MMKEIRSNALLGCMTLLFFHFISFVECSSFNQPHPHQGLVAPYEPKAPKIDLNKKALALLEDGKLFKTQIAKEGGGGRGIVVLDVNAPTATVWSRILDYDNYAKMVNGCTSSKNYNVIQHKPSKSNSFLSQTIYTRMKIGLSVIQLEYFIKHQYHPKLNVLTWTLDYDKTSDLDDSVGYWYIVEHPSKGSNWSRVYYSVDVALPDWLPGFAKDFFSTKALTDATSWVKKESEKQFKKEAANNGEIDTALGEGKKKKKRFWRRPFFLKKNKGKSIPDEEKKRNDETCDSTAEKGVCSASAEQDGLSHSGEAPSAKRAGMIFLVFVLFLYNVGLFLERLSSNQ